MKLSVITICYNEKHIERTCESIVNQTNQDFEWIVIDGGSTDQTLDILNKYKKRINVFISEPDNGIFNAMNKGINLASGEYLNFMNGGDEFASNDIIAQFYHHIECLGMSDIIYGNNLDVFENFSKLVEIPPYFDKKFFLSRTLNHQSSFIKRNLFSIYGLYNENYSVISDWEKFLIFKIHNCTFSYMVGVTVAKFYKDGISSTDKLLKELEILKLKYFTDDEIISQKFIDCTVRLFNVVPILRIKNKPDLSATRVLLFNFIPLYIIRRNRKSHKHFLFGFIPLLKLKGSRL